MSKNETEQNYIHQNEEADRELYGDQYELRLLMKDAKRKAVALFKNDHDDGDTAIYQFISDIVPIVQAYAERQSLLARIDEINRVIPAPNNEIWVQLDGVGHPSATRVERLLSLTAQLNTLEKGEE